MQSKGFTLIELLIVMGLMAMLLVLSVPFVTSLRSDISMQQTLKQVKVDMVSTMNYALAGKSFAALSADDLMNPGLIPAAYALYFETDTDYGDQKPYKYLEFSSEEEGLDKSMNLSYEIEHDYTSPSVYLKQIELVNTKTSAIDPVSRAYILILPPFGKLLFVSDGVNFISGLSEDDFYQNQHDYDEIRLHLQYKDNESTVSVLSLNQSKVINLN